MAMLDSVDDVDFELFRRLQEDYGNLARCCGEAIIDMYKRKQGEPAFWSTVPFGLGVMAIRQNITDAKLSAKKAEIKSRDDRPLLDGDDSLFSLLGAKFTPDICVEYVEEFREEYQGICAKYLTAYSEWDKKETYMGIFFAGAYFAALKEKREGKSIDDLFGDSPTDIPDAEK